MAGIQTKKHFLQKLFLRSAETFTLCFFIRSKAILTYLFDRVKLPFLYSEVALEISLVTDSLTLDFIIFIRSLCMLLVRMQNFIYDYFIAPIWNHEGYNIVNTLAYAVIALVAIYFIYRLIKSKIKVDEKFIRNVLAFVLFGSTVRVVTDSIDSGVFKPVSIFHQIILNSGILNYGYFTVTPGIYIVTAAIMLATLAILYKLKKTELLGYVGLLLWLPNFLLLVPFMTYWIYVIPILILAAIPAYLAWLYFKDKILAGMVAAHALDGAATFFVIDVFSQISGKQYFEQHVISAGIGQLTGTFFTFYLIKVAVSFAAAYLLKKEKMDENDRNFIALAIMIMGFAPGIRDILRMMVGA